MAIALGLTLAPCFMTSCHKDDAKPNDGGIDVPETQFPDVNVPAIDGNVIQSAETQKNYIDEVGKVLLNEFDSKNFTEVIDLFKFIKDKNFGEESLSKSSSSKWDMSEVEDWVRDCIDALTTTDLGNSLDYDYTRGAHSGPAYYFPNYDFAQHISEIFDDYETGKKYTSNYDHEKVFLSAEDIENAKEIYLRDEVSIYNSSNKTSRLYQVSKFKGDFKLVDNKWQKSESDGLKFEFADDQGKVCILKLETSGKTANITGGFSIDSESVIDTDPQEHSLSWNADKTSATVEHKIIRPAEREDRVIEVPENITVTLTRDGKEIFKTVTKTDLDVVSSSEYNLSKDSYAATNVVNILDYSFYTQKANYSSKNNSADAVFSASHGNSKLLQIEGSATNAKINVDDENVYDINLESGQGSVSVDMLGKVQVKGSFIDAKKFFDAMDEAEENEEEAATFKAAIDEANKYIDLNLYFNNGSAKQCKVVLEPVSEEHRWGTSWTYNLAVQFEDGTRFAFDDYAGENDFLGVRDLFDSMQEDYENKLGID
ncbi:MAG: hypothetical protein MJZ61_08300 [Bacteroidales bacterium]|nr:hypothetical protein [Bacteroidales bacterium]